MATAVDPEDLLESARAALKRRRYGDAYRALRRADDDVPLEPDDRLLRLGSPRVGGVSATD